MNRLVADQFPLKSDEFPVGSPKYNDYITALNKVGFSGADICVFSLLCVFIVTKYTGIQARFPQKYVSQ